MAFGRPSIVKRQKEQGRREKQKEKAEKRARRQSEVKTPGVDGEDPDIAGIVPGPQPIVED